jgi:hypothetical protein
MTWFLVFIIYLYLTIGYFRCEWFMVCPPNPNSFPIRRKWVFAEYDMWIGCYIDRKNKRAYWFPVPCLGLKWERGEIEK